METTTDKPAEATQVACEMCLKQVPSSEAIMAEAVDYFAYFCGLECYERWKHRGERVVGRRNFDPAPHPESSFSDNELAKRRVVCMSQLRDAILAPKGENDAKL